MDWPWARHNGKAKLLSTRKGIQKRDCLPSETCDWCTRSLELIQIWRRNCNVLLHKFYKSRQFAIQNWGDLTSKSLLMGTCVHRELVTFVNWSWMKENELIVDLASQLRATLTLWSSLGSRYKYASLRAAHKTVQDGSRGIPRWQEHELQTSWLPIQRYDERKHQKYERKFHKSVIRSCFLKKPKKPKKTTKKTKKTKNKTPEKQVVPDRPSDSAFPSLRVPSKW